MSLLALIQAKKQALAAGRKGKTLKPQNGRGMYRVLPSWRKDAAGNPDLGGQFWHDFGQHFIKDASGQVIAIYVDTEKTFGRPSELNGVLGAAIKATTDDATMTLLKEARSSGSVLLNVLHVDGDKPTEPQILEIRPSVFEQLLVIAEEYEDAGDPLFDLAAGHEIIINREGTGLKTKYSVQAAAKNRGTVPADVMKRVHDLDAYVQQESAEGAFKAINAVKQIAGLLPAPTGGAAGIPTTSAVARIAAVPSVPEEDPYAPAPAPARRAAAPAVAAATAALDDVPDFEADAPAAAAVVDSTGDSELDDLLAGLDK